MANATRNRASQAQAKSGYCLGEIQKPFTNVPRWNGGRSAGSSFGSLRMNMNGMTSKKNRIAIR